MKVHVKPYVPGEPSSNPSPEITQKPNEQVTNLPRYKLEIDPRAMHPVYCVPDGSWICGAKPSVGKQD